MNDIQYKIDKLFDELEETILYKDYVKIKKQLQEDKDINNLIDEIRKYQKIATNNKDESVENKIKELYKKLESYPIYQSYLNIKEELENELYIIKENFSKGRNMDFINTNFNLQIFDNMITHCQGKYAYISILSALNSAHFKSGEQIFVKNDLIKFEKLRREII